MVKFNKNYFILSVLLFCTEILIAKFARDRIIRPYIGDLLVVILIYCFIRSFFNTPPLKTALGVLIFSYSVELLQYFNFITILGLQHYQWARIIIGTSFAWIDLLAYTVGILLVIYIEKLLTAKKTTKKEYWK